MTDHTIYENLANFLKSHGYKVHKKFQRDYLAGDSIAFTYWDVRGRGIRAKFCEDSAMDYAQTTGRIAADNAEMFDRWSTAPLCMIVEGINYDLLLNRLKFLETEKGKEFSTNWGQFEPYEKKIWD